MASSSILPIVSQAAQVPSSQVTCSSPRRPRINCRRLLAGFDDRLHHQLATVTEDSDHNRFLVHVHSDIFDVTTHLSCLLGGKLIRANVYLSPKVKMSSFRAALLEAAVNHPDSGRAANATRTFNPLKRGVLS